MGAAFTKGPWEALPNAHYVHVANKGHVAKVTNPWNDAAERKANTFLIAAAPELYEALAGYVEFIEPTLNAAIEAGYDNTPHVHLMNAAKDALAKARGEQTWRATSIGQEER